jgi:type IV pilus assembly protein PilB
VEEKDPIISFLQQENIVDQNTLASLLEQQQRTGQSLINVLKSESVLNEEQFTRVVAFSNKIEFVNLSPDMVDSMAAHLVSYDLVNRYSVIPIRKEDNKLLVAMSSPLNLSVRDQIEMKTGYKVVPLAATPSAIRQAIHYHFDVENVTKQTIVSMRLKEEPSRHTKEHGAEKKTVKVFDDPITKLVSSLIRGAIDSRASDIHIEPQETDVRVRYRIDGILRGAVAVPASAQLEVVSYIKIMSDMDISEKRVPQDGHMTMRHDGKDYDLRVSSLPAIGGEKIVIRILDKNVDRWSLDAVVTEPNDNRSFREMVSNPYGMMLLTGPTGCGKTTTLYSVLQLINTPEKNIVTVEDPVEYRLNGITQVQVRPIAGRTFASALRSILRQDPDVILVGEIRDLETAEIAISAALTGHLVLSTLHTNDAAGAISRLVNIGIPPFLVGSALLGTVAQRLVRTLCPKCRRAYSASEEELKILLGNDYGENRPQLYQGTGCNSCYQTGYQGRKSIYEILCISREIRKMILDGKNDNEIKQRAVEEGMRTLRRSAIDDVLKGVTSLEEIMRVVDIGRE